jgi:hypothetical protein
MLKQILNGKQLVLDFWYWYKLKTKYASTKKWGKK